MHILFSSNAMYNIYTAGFIKMVPLYTLLMNIIYLSLSSSSTQVYGGTVLRKHAVCLFIRNK